MKLLKRRLTADERGSALIVALMITAGLALLGVALFDLTTLDARLIFGNEADYRARELAQSAIERTLHLLYLDMCDGVAACTNPPANASWADGVINGATFTGDTSQFQNVTGWGTSGAQLTTFGDGTTFADVTTAQSYYVQVKNIATNLPGITSEASNLGITCTPDFSFSPPRCKDAIYARATATFNAGVQTSTRTIQVVARATFNSGLGGGLLAGSPASGTITGNSELHGSLHIVPCASGTCAQLSFTGNTGIFNNYNGLSSAMQHYVPPLPTIVCPPSTACAGLTVETLDAIVRVAKPDNNTLHLGGSAAVGESGSGSNNSVTGIRGKPTVEGVYLGDGCQTASCSDQVDAPTHVHTDRPIRGYDQVPAPVFPMLDDPATVFTRSYDDYAACSGPGVCNSSGAVVSGSGNDFFISHAAKILSTTTTDTTFQCGAATCPQGGASNLLTLVSGGTWDDNTATFSFTFTCGGGGVTCDDADSNRVNGSINGSKPDGFQLEWNKANQTISIYQCPVGQTVACGSITLVARTPGGISSGTRRYRVAYVDGSGTEFQVSVPVSISMPASSQITAQAAVGPTGTVSRRLYRFRTSDNTWRRVATWADNLPATVSTIDNVADGSLGSQTALLVALNEGLLSVSCLTAVDCQDKAVSQPTLPVLIYVDDRLKICDGCNASHPAFSFRGNAIFLAKGNTADIATSNTASVSIDTDLLPACAGTCPVNTAAPQQNLFRFYTPGNLFMGKTAQRKYVGEFYTGSKWATAKQTDLLGDVTAQVFDMGSQVPSFWQFNPPHTATAFPPRGSRWSLKTVRWKECVGTIGTGPC